MDDVYKDLNESSLEWKDLKNSSFYIVSKGRHQTNVEMEGQETKQDNEGKRRQSKGKQKWALSTQRAYGIQ